MIKIIIYILILGLFLYSKLLPYKDKLSHQYKGIFNFFDALFTPIFNFMRKFIKPFQVGFGLAVDMSQIVLLILFLILLQIFR